MITIPHAGFPLPEARSASREKAIDRNIEHVITMRDRTIGDPDNFLVGRMRIHRRDSPPDRVSGRGYRYSLADVWFADHVCLMDAVYVAVRAVSSLRLRPREDIKVRSSGARRPRLLTPTCADSDEKRTESTKFDTVYVDVSCRGG